MQLASKPRLAHLLLPGMQTFSADSLFVACVSVPCRDGRLVQAATRGDGREGEDVTHNVTTPGAVQGLTVTVSGTAGGKAVPAEFEVRGEIYIRSSDFDKVRISSDSVRHPT